MLFNSIEFAVFLPIVFFLYWTSHKRLNLQNTIIVLASYCFYGWWNWRFLSLIIFSTIVDYSIGLLVSKESNERKRKLLLFTSIFVNLGLLVFFKYSNFFVQSFIDTFSFFGYQIENKFMLNIILPVGISFYTFQTMSYTIDIYKKNLEPVNNFITFAAFVCFFPQLVAGPIERASNLLPQFSRKREFQYNDAIDGLRQILWGFFKKVIIADNCAHYVNLIFNNYSDYSGIALVVGAILFSFQIYGDFSGYSDIAIGVSKLFGFRLMKNFAFPYFSRDIAEFWKRWHISLSTWFRDYLYIPLGGSRVGKVLNIRNVFIIFLVSGFWHGANWTFIAWGALHALWYLPSVFYKSKNLKLKIVASGNLIPTFNEIISILGTFSLVTFSWIFFRSSSISDAISFIFRIFVSPAFDLPYYLQELKFLILIVLLCFFILLEWFGREGEYALSFLSNHPMPKISRNLFYYAMIGVIFLFRGHQQDFIYFQF